MEFSLKLNLGIVLISSVVFGSAQKTKNHLEPTVLSNCFEVAGNSIIDLGLDGVNSGVYYYAGTLPSSFLNTEYYSRYTPGLLVKNFGNETDSNAFVNFSLVYQSPTRYEDKREYHSKKLPIINPGDSVWFAGNTCDSLNKQFLPFGGSLNMNYEIVTSKEDRDTSNNLYSNSVSISAATLSKSRWDFKNNRPVVNLKKSAFVTVNESIAAVFKIPQGSFFSSLIRAIGFIGVSIGSLQNVYLTLYIVDWKDVNVNGIADKSDSYELLSAETKTWEQTNLMEDYFSIQLTDFNSGEPFVRLDGREKNIVAVMEVFSPQGYVVFGFDQQADYQGLVSFQPLGDNYNILYEPFLMGMGFENLGKKNSTYANLNAGLSLGLEFCCIPANSQISKNKHQTELKVQNTHGILSVNLNMIDYKSNVLLKLLALDGKVIQSKQKDVAKSIEWEIQTSDLARGFYIITAKTNIDLISKMVYIY